MTTTGDWCTVQVNGVNITPDSFSLQWTHAFKANPVMAMNVGVEQSAVGAFDPKATLQGYVNSAIAQQTAHNLFSKTGLGANDIEYLVLAMLGQNAIATVGDEARIGGFTLNNYDVPLDPQTVMQLTVPFVGRGRFGGLANVIANYTGVGSGYAPIVWDRGANAASGTLFGAQALLQVVGATGTAATGSITVPTQPVAADSVTINGQLYTWVAAGPIANQILIGTNALDSANNLYSAIIGGTTRAGTGYGTGTTKASATAVYSPPTGASNTINILYLTTGVAGNSFTLAKTGTGGLTISGATLTGGVAGDTYTFTISTATTSGGSYTTVATFTALGNVIGAEWQTVLANVTLNRFVKFVATPVSGSSQAISFACGFAPLWSL